MSPFYDAPVERQVEALAEMARAALAQYDGTFAALESIKYRENAIFSVQRADGRRFALRIHRPNYHSDAALASELAWMRALSASGLPVPEVELNSCGEAITLASAPGVPEVRRTDLLAWVEGTPLMRLEAWGELPRSRRLELYRAIGALTAGLHNQAERWTLPAGFERHDWFTDALIGETPLWGRFWHLPGLTPAQRSLLEEVRLAAARVLAGYPRSPGNSGLIHADLIADNLMIDGESIRPIDFDDAGFGWHMFDIATTLYFVAEDPDFAALRDALLQGYTSLRLLARAETDALPLFLMLRGTTYLGWVGSRSETATARELAPDLIRRCCAMCEAYLASPEGCSPAAPDEQLRTG